MIRRFPILLALVIAAAPILCVCHASIAMAQASKPADPHACCKKDKPVEHSEKCHHCDGSSSLTALAPQKDIAAHTLPPVWFASIDLIVWSPLVIPWSLLPLPIDAAPPAPPSTLFALHCAQIC